MTFSTALEGSHFFVGGRREIFSSLQLRGGQSGVVATWLLKLPLWAQSPSPLRLLCPSCWCLAVSDAQSLPFDVSACVLHNCGSWQSRQQLKPQTTEDESQAQRKEGPRPGLCFKTSRNNNHQDSCTALYNSWNTLHFKISKDFGLSSLRKAKPKEGNSLILQRLSSTNHSK